LSVCIKIMLFEGKFLKNLTQTDTHALAHTIALITAVDTFKDYEY